MKKKIGIALCGIALALSLTGCRETKITNVNGEETYQLGQFIVLEDKGDYVFGEEHHHQYLVYDKDTKIIYIYEIMYSGYLGGTAISPYYCMDMDNNPVIAVYHD